MAVLGNHRVWKGEQRKTQKLKYKCNHCGELKASGRKININYLARLVFVCVYVIYICLHIHIYIHLCI